MLARRERVALRGGTCAGMRGAELLVPVVDAFDLSERDRIGLVVRRDGDREILILYVGTNVAPAKLRVSVADCRRPARRVVSSQASGRMAHTFRSKQNIQPRAGSNRWIGPLDPDRPYVAVRVRAVSTPERSDLLNERILCSAPPRHEGA